MFVATRGTPPSRGDEDRVRVKWDAASRYPSDESRNYVAAAAARTRPSDPKLVEWHTKHWQRHLERVALDLDLVRLLADSQTRILEIGACPLMLTAPLKELGYHLECIDLAPSRFADRIEELGLVVHALNIETDDLSPLNDRYDLIVMNEVFEHLRLDLVNTMEKVHDLLTPGGLFLMSTPNIRSFEGMLNIVVHDRGYALCGEIAEEFGKLKAHGHMGHVREYTAGDVSNLLSAVGFDIVGKLFRGQSRRFGYAGRVARLLVPSARPFFSILARRVIY